MSEEIARLGTVSISIAFSRCDACATVGARRAQITGPDGYVNLCGQCALFLANKVRAWKKNLEPVQNSVKVSGKRN